MAMFTLLPWLLEQLRGGVFSVRYVPMPTKKFIPIKERVLCEIRDEANEIVEHEAYNTTQQDQMATIRQTNLLLGLL